MIFLIGALEVLIAMSITLTKGKSLRHVAWPDSSTTFFFSNECSLLETTDRVKLLIQ